MNILILSRGPNLYSTRRLIGTFRKRGHRVQIVDPLLCNLLMDGKRAVVLYKDREVKGFDLIVPRIGTSVTEYGIAVLEQFALQNVPMLNSSQAIRKSRDKLRAIQIMTQYGIRIPKSLMTRDPSGIPKLVRKIDGPPMVLKLLQGTQGVGVMLAESVQAAESVLDTLWSLEQNILIQQFVSEASGKDVRAIVVGGEVVAAMRRRAKKGEFRANIHRGGRGEPIYKLGAEYRDTAVAAAKAVGLNFAGVDMLETRDGPAVMEINSTPGLEGVEKTTQVDVAATVVDFALRFCQNYRSEQAI